MRSYLRRATASLGAVALSFAFTTAALSAGDGRTGPVQITGAAIDEALVALNDFLQGRYLQEDRLAALTAPPPQDFVTTAVATASVPQMRSGAVAEFGVLVAGDASLDNSIDYLNRQVLNRGTDLFIQVAEAAAGKGPDFADVAKSIDADTVLQRYGSQLAALQHEFGQPVSDDETLDTLVADINSHIQGFDQREVMLAQAVPAVTGDSFDRMVLALLIVE